MIDHLTTVLITCSPSKMHPSTDIIDSTVASIRWHFPEAEILIACDGVRPEQQHYKQRYSEFVLRLETFCFEKWKNVLLWVEPEFVHQAVMVKRAMENVGTPLVLFTESDMEILQIQMPWDDMSNLMPNNINLIRFQLEDQIKPEWAKFMLGAMEVAYGQLTRTIQWSQRTHLASTAYYKRMLEKLVKPGDRCYLEDRFYGNFDDWDEHRLTIYTPEGPQCRIKHTDARGGDEKFESFLVKDEA